MQEVIPEGIDAGKCTITVEIEGSFLQAHEMMVDQTKYIIRKGITNSLDSRLVRARRADDLVQRILFGEYGYSADDDSCRINIQVALVLALTRDSDQYVEQILNKVIKLVCAAVMMMVAEQDGRNELLSPQELETLLQFVEDAVGEHEAPVVALHAA